MNQQVIGLVVVACLATLLVVSTQRNPAEQGPQLVFTGLADGLDEVQEIRIKGATVTTLTRQAEGWSLVEKSGYPADIQQVSRFLLNLAALEIAETKTNRPENHARLGLMNEGPDSGVRVGLGPDIGEIIVGIDGASRGTFFRRAGDAQVYLTDVPLEVNSNPLDWLDKVVIDVAADSVREVEIGTRDAGYLRAIWDESAQALAIQNVPAGRELRYAGISDSLARMFVNLRLEDVEPYQSGFFIDPSMTRVTLVDGTEIVVSTVQSADTFWVHIDQQGLSDWQFEISEFAYGELNKTLADMLQPIEEVNPE